MRLYVSVWGCMCMYDSCICGYEVVCEGMCATVPVGYNGCVCVGTV